MRKFSLHLIALLMVMNVYSQSKMQSEYEEWKPSQNEYLNFDISKYFTPDIVRNQLSINFDLNSDYSRSNSDYKKYEMNGISTNSNFTGNMASAFSRYVNTRRKITNLAVGLSLNDKYTAKNNTIKYSNSNSNNMRDDVNHVFANSLGLDWSNKRYFSKLFLNYNLYGNLSYSSTQDKVKNQSAETKSKENEFVFQFSPRLGAGYGRIENVEDARQAAYIAHALSKRNRLTRNLSNDELFELSQKISTVKNKRFLDSRLHLIDEISAVDSFFVKNDLLSESDAAYFTTLYDLWQYGDLFPRKSGYEISFVMIPSYTYDYLKSIPELQEGAIHYPHRALLETRLSLNYEKPFRLNWQHSAEASINAYFHQGKEGKIDFESIFSTRNKYLSSVTRYSLAYYPNTRTHIKAMLGQQLWKGITKTIEGNEDFNTQYVAMLNITANYYLSPHFRIAGSYNMNYEHHFGEDKIKEHFNISDFSTSLNIRLIYSIF